MLYRGFSSSHIVESDPLNNLSLFLYLANVFQNIGCIFVAIGVVTALFIALCFVFRVMLSGNVSNSDLPDDDHPFGTRDYRAWNTVKGFTEKKILYVLSLSMLLIAGLIPSKQTMYMIAASEISEMAIVSDTGQEILTDVKAALKNILKGE